MRRSRYLITLALVVTLAACGSPATNCTEYAAELDDRLAASDSAEDILNWIDDTADDVARLIHQSESDGEICATAILEAMFTAGLSELEAELDSLLSE